MGCCFPGGVLLLEGVVLSGVGRAQHLPRHSAGNGGRGAVGNPRVMLCELQWAGELQGCPQPLQSVTTECHVLPEPACPDGCSSTTQNSHKGLGGC